MTSGEKAKYISTFKVQPFNLSLLPYPSLERDTQSTLEVYSDSYVKHENSDNLACENTMIGKYKWLRTYMYLQAIWAD